MDQNILNTKKADQRRAREAAAYAYQNRRWTFSDIWDAYDKPSAAKSPRLGLLQETMRGKVRA